MATLTLHQRCIIAQVIRYTYQTPRMIPYNTFSYRSWSSSGSEDSWNRHFLINRLYQNGDYLSHSSQLNSNNANVENYYPSAQSTLAKHQEHKFSTASQAFYPTLSFGFSFHQALYPTLSTSFSFHRLYFQRHCRLSSCSLQTGGYWRLLSGSRWASWCHVPDCSGLMTSSTGAQAGRGPGSGVYVNVRPVA